MRIKNSHRKITMTRTQTQIHKPHRSSRGVKKGARPAEVGALASVFKKISYRAQTQTKTTKMQTNNTDSDI